jgi:hypothetical protein
VPKRSAAKTAATALANNRTQVAAAHADCSGDEREREHDEELLDRPVHEIPPPVSERRDVFGGIDAASGEAVGDAQKHREAVADRQSSRQRKPTKIDQSTIATNGSKSRRTALDRARRAASESAV